MIRQMQNDRAMIRQMQNVKPQDTATIRSTELLARLSIENPEPDTEREKAPLEWTRGTLQRSSQDSP